MTRAAGLAARGIEVIRWARARASNVAGGASVLTALIVVLGVVGMAAPASAIDFFDGKIQVHGYYEQDIRSLWSNFDTSQTWDLSQWQHILDLETDYNIAPDGWGPFDSISGFTRVEVRFDCVWTRGCGLMRTADAYGDRTNTGTLHDPLGNGTTTGYQGAQYVGGVAPFRWASPTDALVGPSGAIVTTPSGQVFHGPGVQGRNRGVPIYDTQTFGIVFANGVGPDGIRGTFNNPGDDPVWAMYGTFLGQTGNRCLFAPTKVKSPDPAGFAVHDFPVNPGCTIRNLAVLRNYPNPWNPAEITQLGSTAVPGAGALPYRPAPLLAANAPGNNDMVHAQGNYYPTEVLARRLKNNDFGAFDQNYTQNQLQWNHGASQQETYELKEAYLDLEMFDSRLWLRAGKQEIVWGKTELFRNQDRFNPQDLALSTLPTLEESRIPLWALRGVWSFYEVGPFSDVRLEGALDLNNFQPNDLGRCGEPYTPLLVCDKAYGLLTHGMIGIGLEGEIRPPRIFHDWKSLQGGLRLEWRYDRFSFALTDYYGFNPSPIAPVDFHYNRNVDPATGRPREAFATGSCVTGAEAACLTPSEALTKSPLNQTIYSWLCANTVGLVENLLGAPDCPLIGLFNSAVKPPGSPFKLGFTLNQIMAGSALGKTSWSQLASGTSTPTLCQLGGTCSNQILAHLAVPAAEQISILGGGYTPLVDLSVDAGDSVLPANAVAFGSAFTATQGLSAVLSPQQQALVGCGVFYARDCDSGLKLDPTSPNPNNPVVLDSPASPSYNPGIDLLNSEASVLLQSWTISQGTLGVSWSTLDKTRAQPGTVGFQPVPIGTRPTGNNSTTIIAGAHGASDPGYVAAQDGTTTGPSTVGAHSPRAQPFTGQLFRSEMAVLSWNLEMALAGLNVDATGQDPGKYDPNNPFRMGACSLAQPQYCVAVAGLVQEAMTTRPTVKAGGNSRYGRWDWVWAQGYEQYIDYAKTNVLGFSTDFAEDRTKTNWSVEFTWENNLPVQNLYAADQTTDTDLFNLTISVDRPTFINFLNANRTFFFNSQFFIQYVSNYQKGFQMEGPYNFLWTIAVNTGYFQDRLLPSLVAVWDFNSDSGALLPQVSYRFTENFSATFGVSVFGGRYSRKNGGIADQIDRIAVTPNAQTSYVQNGLSPISDRDEFFMKIRYTF